MNFTQLNNFLLVTALLLPLPVQATDDKPAVSSGSTDWPVHGGSDLEQRFSPLTQVNKETVEKLDLAWSVELNSRRGQESTPIVVDG